jgi:pyrroline-5-carboxylate reductase
VKAGIQLDSGFRKNGNNMTTKGRGATEMKIAFIGGGNMGEAMLSAVIAKRITRARDIIVADISEPRRHFLEQKYTVLTTPDNQFAVSGVNLVVLAIKPQTLPAVAEGLKGKLKPSQLVISIIAGKTISTLRDGLAHKRIVRSMPNTPAQIGEGVTVWTITGEVTITQKKQAACILGAMGKQFYVDNERFLDMATAVSGSGPAYLFYFVESFVNAAVAIGWDNNVARELVMGTILGAAHLLEQSGREPADLRRMVTSPGGTTAEAIRILDEGKFQELITSAVKAAYEKATQLGRG